MAGSFIQKECTFPILRILCQVRHSIKLIISTIQLHRVSGRTLISSSNAKIHMRCALQNSRKCKNLAKSNNGMLANPMAKRLFKCKVTIFLITCTLEYSKVSLYSTQYITTYYMYKICITFMLRGIYKGYKQIPFTTLIRQIRQFKFAFVCIHMHMHNVALL